MIKIADLHCDSITRAYDGGFTLDDARLHLSPAHIPPGCHWLQVMAIYVPDALRGTAAVAYFDHAYSFYQEYLQTNPDKIAVLENLRDADNAMQANKFTGILSVEGGAVLQGDADNVDMLYDKGVRLLTLTWNSANELCGGVLSGGGFTPAGRAVVQRMEKRGMIVDVSHLSDEGFFELCDFAEKPFIASHSNARAVCPHPRNVTDDMFREIISRGGLVGLNFYEHFIKEGGTAHPDDMLRHIHHLLELGGEDTLALGSDFDGADIPDYISGAEKVPYFEDVMLRSGISQFAVTKIMSANALRFFAKIGR